MRVRGVALVGALTLLVNALFGVSWSGASWSNRTTTALAVIAANDWTPPSVTVSPLASAVQGTVTVSATASDARSAIDPASVVVEYSAVGTTAWTAYAGCTRSGTNPVTASCAWNTTLLPDGDYLVRARATDTAGYSSTSTTVATTIRNAASVKLTRLATYLRGTVPVTGTITSGGASTARIYLERSPSGADTFAQLNGGCTAGPVTTLTCQWNTAAVTDGTYDVRARAVTTSTSLDVQTGVIIDNTAPAATLSVPAGVLSGNVALNATASDATSGVASVALEYRLASSSGAFTACAPVLGTYTCNLDTRTLTNGATYDFRSVATDVAGNATATASESRVVDNSAATVAIASPASGAVLGGVTTVTVNATSPRGVSTVRVEYRSAGTTGWATACTPAAAPYSCSWDTRALGGGSYELRAVAVETYGGAAPISALVPITINNADGTVTVTQPTGGAVVSGTATLTASTVSPTGVTSVALQVRKSGATGWTTVCTVTSGPYSCGWATPAEYDTSWQVQAVMTQGNQRVVTSPAVNVTVRNLTGSVAVTSPAAGSTVRGSAVSLTATATSNAPITAVKFQVTAPNGTVTDCAATGTGPYACTWNTSAITYGSYVIVAVMTHGGTTQTSAPVTVTVDNRVVKGVDVQAANGGTAGVPDAGDTLTFTYSSLMNLSTIQSGLTYGGTVAIGTTLTGSTGQLGDTLAFPGSNLGSVTVSSNFYSNNKTLTFSGSTITASQGTDAGNPVTVLTVRLGTAGTIPAGESLKSVTTAGALIWTPSAGATDTSGVASATTALTESGAADRDF